MLRVASYFPINCNPVPYDNRLGVHVAVPVVNRDLSRAFPILRHGSPANLSLRLLLRRSGAFQIFQLFPIFFHPTDRGTKNDGLQKRGIVIDICRSLSF